MPATINSRIRSVFFWIHLVFGLSAGVVILVMSVTGVLLGFERQTIAWIDGTPKAAPPNGAPRLPLDSLFARATIDRAEVASIALRSGETDVVTVRFRARDKAPVALDPYTGAAITIPTGGKAAAAMSALRRWHRWMGAAAEPLRGQMKSVTGAANLMFLFLVLSGFYLWWPRRWTASIVKSITVMKFSLSGKPRDFNWHNAIGFWSAVPLAFVVATAAFISYQWPGRLLDRTLGSPAEKQAAIEAGRAASQASAPSSAAAAGPATPPPAPPSRIERAGDAPLAALFASVESARPEWKTATITMPGARDSVVTVAVAEGNTYRPDLRTTVLVSAATAELRAVRGYDSLSTSRKIRAWYRFGHTGEVFGVVGQTIATLASLGGVFLVYTGIALALRRAAAWLRRRRTPAPAPEPTFAGPAGPVPGAEAGLS